MAGEPELHPNTSDQWVQYLQQLLRAAGYSCPEDGSFDATTLDAVHQLQASAGIAQSDVVRQDTWDAALTAAGVGPTADTGTQHAEAAAAHHDEGPWPGAQTVKIWFKAFIPGDAPGTIDGVGASSGHRLLQGPISWFNDCFHTDTRGFSSNIGASARMHSEVVIDVATGAKVSENHHCGQTIEADCEDGDHECAATADTGGMSFGEPTHHGHAITIGLAGAASNPCFTGAPDIDYSGTYTIDLHAHTVSFEGLVNGFPAYESYATVNNGAGETVFQYGPRGEPGDLAGGPTDGVSGTAQL